MGQVKGPVAAGWRRPLPPGWCNRYDSCTRAR